MKMPFGKYSGKEISKIAEVNQDYLFWVLANVRKISAPLRKEIEKYAYQSTPQSMQEVFGDDDIPHFDTSDIRSLRGR